MPGRTAACFRAAAVAAVVALIVVPLSPASSGPVLAQVPPPGAGSGDDFQTDGPEQKAADLERAAANGGASPDRLVVVYRNAPSANHPTRLQVRQQIGGQLLRALGSINEDVIRLPSGSADAVAAQVRQLPGVRDAYPDRVVNAALAVNDERFGDEWGLGKIQAPTAWDTSQAAGVKLAILDCGIHAAHPDLAGKVVLEQNFSASTTSDDLCNHGTHVAGIAGALTNNGIGVAAVAPAAQLINAKVLGDGGSGYFSDIDAAIQWASDSGAQVINMSLGADIPCPTGTQAAADYAWNKGAVLVAAAGNSAQETAHSPARCNNVIGVAATDVSDALAWFSNYGAEVDVAAPGVSILSTVNPDLNGGTAYKYLNGTSMATPYTAGVLALIWSTSHGTSATAVRDRLFGTADHVSGTGSLWTYGRINAAAAVAGSIAGTPTPTPTAGGATSTPIPSPTITPTATATATKTSADFFTATATVLRTPGAIATSTPANASLAVKRLGSGSGTVSSSPLGINCGSDCTELYSPGTVVTVSEIAAAGSTFTGWSGGCTGKAASCSLTMDAAKTVKATFKLNADLAIAMVDSPDPVTVGSVLTYTLTASNHGPNAASNAKVTHVLPKGVTVGGVTASQGTCTTSATVPPKVTCSLGTFAVNGSATITVVVRPTVGGSLTSTATVNDSATYDLAPDNNKAKTTTSAT